MNEYKPVKFNREDIKMFVKILIVAVFIVSFAAIGYVIWGFMNPAPEEIVINASLIK